MNSNSTITLKVAALSLLTFVAFLVTACDSAPEGADGGSTRTFEKNREMWALPLDQFQFQSDLTVVDANQMIVHDCMTSRGFGDFPIIPINLDAPRSLSESPGGQRLFNVPLAEQWGYRKAPSKQVNLYEWMDTLDKYQRQATPEELRNLSACTKIADEKIWQGFDQSRLQRAAGYSTAIDPRDDEAVKAASKRWQECMAPLGLPNLPSDPMEMGSTAVKSDSNSDTELSQDGDSMVYVEKVPESEIEIASADARCRESSGYAEALYDSQFQADLEAYRKHEDELRGIKARNEEFAAHLESILAEYR